MNVFLRSLSLIALAFAVSLPACKNSGNQEKEEIDSVAVQNRDKAAKVFFAIPSPAELATMIKVTGAKFDKAVMNPTSNVTKYTTINAKALNLGVYGADLSYASTFDQTQESMQYMNTCKKLADGLGITNAVNESTIKRLENNLNNKDSLLSIISDTYMETDMYLKNNDRASTAALVVAGGWLEGLFISVNVANNNKTNTDIMNRIAEQKIILDNLSGLLDSYKSDPAVAAFISDLSPVKAAFAKVGVTETSGGEASTDEAAGKTTLPETSTMTVTPELLNEITKATTELRKKITG
jgi:hypothetical protein